jgi:hypothetical protein
MSAVIEESKKPFVPSGSIGSDLYPEYFLVSLNSGNEHKILDVCSKDVKKSGKQSDCFYISVGSLASSMALSLFFSCFDPSQHKSEHKVGKFLLCQKPISLG